MRQQEREVSDQLKSCTRFRRSVRTHGQFPRPAQATDVAESRQNAHDGGETGDLRG